MKLKYDCIDYLKEQKQPWIEYGIKRFLEKNEVVTEELKKHLLSCEEVKKTIEIVEQWPEPSLVRHNDVNHPIHKAHLLLEMGMDGKDKVIQDLAKKILENQNEEGAFTPELIFTGYKGWDFGQKKLPSPTLTLAIAILAENI